MVSKGPCGRAGRLYGSNTQNWISRPGINGWIPVHITRATQHTGGHTGALMMPSSPKAGTELWCNGVSIGSTGLMEQVDGAAPEQAQAPASHSHLSPPAPALALAPAASAASGTYGPC